MLGAHTLSRRQGRPPIGRGPLSPGPPGGPPVSIFCYIITFTLKKIVGKLTGRNSAATRRNLGGINLGLRRSCSAGDTSLREAEIITNIITNDPLIGRGSISINIFTSTISSQNPSSSLVSNLCTKTSDWYMWVASSVDYSLKLMLVGLFSGRSYVQIHYAY